MTTKIEFSGPTKRLINCTIEAYTEGDHGRAHARARLQEVAPGLYLVIPCALREISGPEVPWREPDGAAPVLGPIAGFDEACQSLVFWATVTFARNRRM